eukprot:TRINITY_DN28008_c0_g1_i1.p1 TRINITY_DN28008_c0_g1~~TRINITY_DN28008_c0_g1_i1.p1  ORF type:complete len:378 (+),score=38.66 TRINITY_DN28008_c0_g1_i1:56-1135(+)
MVSVDDASVRSRRGAKRATETHASDEPVSERRVGKGRFRHVVSTAFALLLVLVVAWFIRSGWETLAASSSTEAPRAEPAVFGFRVVKRYRHDPEAFTQGLLWLNGSLYESLGLYDKSAVRELQLVDAASSEDKSVGSAIGEMRVVREVRNAPHEFGEGLVHVGDGELMQLLWRVSDVVRYSARPGEGGHLERRHKGSRTSLTDGWGLEFDGTSLLATDSGPDVYFLDPETLAQQRSIRVQDEGRTIEMVNELELIDGELFANIFGSECVAKISPATGSVIAWIDLTGLLDRRKASEAARKRGLAAPDVLNGIAWDPSSRRLFVTGKLWPRLYEIELVPSNLTLTEMRDRCIPQRNFFRQ